MRIIALATSHNRRSLTLSSLQSLYQQQLPSECELDVYLVDDGSTDGTAKAVAKEFPEATVIHGTGELFWAGGMRYGWDNYVKNEKFDYLLVFNDDINLYSNAISKLISTAQSLEKLETDMYAITGAFKDPKKNIVAYGGLKRNSVWHPLRFSKVTPNETIQECDTLNMNAALISRAALFKVGFFSDGFIHGKADYDFGLRLRASGGLVVLAPGYIGECSVNSLKGTSSEPNIPFSERWRRLTSMKEQMPSERALYFRTHAGLFWPLLWVLPYIRICIEGIIYKLVNQFKR